MVLESQAIVRSVSNKDRTQLANMIHFGTFVHRHLDWRPPLDWIGHKPFVALERNSRLIAAFACPPDPPNIAWIRVFVCESHFSQTKAWQLLWPKVKTQLLEMNVKVLAAIPLQKWYRELLLDQGFEHIQNVISLAWETKPTKGTIKPSNFKIRQMQWDDLPKVFKIDSLAFNPLWQNSAPLIELAFDQAVSATVAVSDAGIIGYQITTPTQYGAHLGRLAVHPKAQRKGVGFALVQHLKEYLAESHFKRLSVNTQDSNLRSISLYHKAGFSETSEVFPILKLSF